LSIVILAICACASVDSGSTGSPEGRKIVTAVQAYYTAITLNDVDAQAGFWVSSMQDEGRRQAKAWMTRVKDGLKPDGFHVEDTGEPNVKLVHYYLIWQPSALNDPPAPEGKAAQMENVDGKWLFQDLR
jgi:hypothetical protein